MPDLRLRPNKFYTRSQMKRLMTAGEAEHWRNLGYVLQFDTNSNMMVLTHSSTAAGSGVTSEGLFTPPPPIQKRTPAQRVDSLMLKWIDDMKRAGTLPGVADAQVQEIVGEAWKSGRSEVTAEMVRTVASHFLTKAEEQHEEKLGHQSTRHED